MDKTFTVKILIAEELLFTIQETPAFMELADGVMEICNRSKPVFIPDGSRLRRVRPENILYIEADGNYCTIHCLENPQLVVAVLLNKLVDELAGHGIIRCHKRYAVNIEAIEFVGGNYLVLQDGAKIDMGETYKKDVLARFNVIGTRSTKYT